MRLRRRYNGRIENEMNGGIQYNFGGLVPEFYPDEPFPSPTNTTTPSITPTITLTPSISPTISLTPSITKSPTPTPSITKSQTPTPSITPTITKTPTLTPTKTPTQSLSVFSYLGRTTPDQASGALACSNYLTIRSYFSNKTLASLTIGDYLYDSYPATPTNGGNNWVALKVGGVGQGYAFQVATDGEILDTYTC